LENGASRQSVAVGIALSKEEQGDLAPTFQTGVFVPSQSDAEVARLYYGVLDRPPDASGLAFWENAISQGTSPTTIATDLINSPESTTKFGSPSDAQFVNALYEGALGRPADPLGELRLHGGPESRRLARQRRGRHLREPRGCESSQLADRDRAQGRIGLFRRSPAVSAENAF